MLRISVSGRISCILGLGISCLGIPVLCKGSLSDVAGIISRTGRCLSAGNLGRLVSPGRLVSLHLGISCRLGIALGILVSLGCLIFLLILISLLCGISGIGGSAGIASLRITVLLRISTLIGVLIFLSHIFSFPLQAVIVAL